MYPGKKRALSAESTTLMHNSKLRRSALLQHIVQEYYDVSILCESDETLASNPDRMSLEYKYRHLQHEATNLNDEVQRHIYLHVARDCRMLCDAIYRTLPRELRDIIYDFLFDAMQPPPPREPSVRYYVFRCVEDPVDEEPQTSHPPPETYEDLPPPRSDRDNAHVGDVAFIGQQMLYEMAQTWSRRSTIIVAEGWQGVFPVEYSYWDDEPVSKDSTNCIVLQITYPIVKYGQDFSGLERDLAVLEQFKRPLNILIDWDTQTIVRHKIRNADVNFFEYFDNIVELCPLLKVLLDSGHRVRMTFKQYRESFQVERGDLENDGLVSKAHKARCETHNPCVKRQGCYYGNIWTCGGDVYLPRVLSGLC